jgi:hypothetical protein
MDIDETGSLVSLSLSLSIIRMFLLEMPIMGQACGQKK